MNAPLMARALPLSLLASLLVAEPAFAQANFEGLADNILGLLSNGLLRTLAIIAIIAIVAAVVAIVVAILAATTGIFIVHKKMHTLDHHSFEGEMVVAQSVPMGMQITDPNLEVGEQAFANPMNGV